MSDYEYGASSESEAWERAYQASHPLGQYFDELAQIRDLLPKARKESNVLAQLAVLRMEHRLLEIEYVALRAWIRSSCVRSERDREHCAAQIHYGVRSRAGVPWR